MKADFKKIAGQLEGRPEVRLAYLFGSRAKGKASPRSDTDIAVLLQGPIHDWLRTKLELVNLFQDGVAGEVDITILNTAGSVLKYQVVKNGTLLFERTPGEHKEFTIMAWKEYFDFQPTLEFFYQRKIA